MPLHKARMPFGDRQLYACNRQPVKANGKRQLKNNRKMELASSQWD